MKRIHILQLRDDLFCPYRLGQFGREDSLGLLFPLLSFCPVGLSTDDSGVLKSTILVVLESVSPFRCSDKYFK